jgi:hypothetical protein
LPAVANVAIELHGWVVPVLSKNPLATSRWMTREQVRDLRRTSQSWGIVGTFAAVSPDGTAVSFHGG